MNIQPIEERLQVCFKDSTLLQQAFTHNSFSQQNYQRLEFLGDAVLQLIISEMLVQHFPDAREGQLSQMRSHLVRGEQLADLLARLDLAGFIRTGKSLSNVEQKQAILADVFESTLAAIYLDGGYQQALEFAERQFGPLIDELSNRDSFKDAKTRLQEWLQKQGKSLPVYTLLAEHGKPPESVFEVLCTLPDYSMEMRQRATTRKQAEQQAAELLLNQLNEESVSDG